MGSVYEEYDIWGYGDGALFEYIGHEVWKVNSVMETPRRDLTGNKVVSIRILFHLLIAAEIQAVGERKEVLCTPSTFSNPIFLKEARAGFADEGMYAKGTHDEKKKRDSFYQHQEAGKQEKNQMGLLTMDDGIVNWGEHTKDEETNHALMAISSSSEEEWNALMEKNRGRKWKMMLRLWNKGFVIRSNMMAKTKFGLITSGLIIAYFNLVLLDQYILNWTNINSVRPTVNTGSSNINTVRSRQPEPTRTSNSFSPKRPQGNWGTAVKTLAGYN
ncbi:hypothetical protein Tco_0575210 [Tanacetum coccineum]